MKERCGMRILVFDYSRYVLAQKIEALTCPVNRDSTRREHNCNDMDLFHHPEWLMENYIKKGGSDRFRERRAQFMIEVEDAAKANSVLASMPQPEYYI